MARRRRTTPRLAVWLLLGAGLAAAGGCYDRPRPECAFLCGADQACPDGYGCRADGWCVRDDVSAGFVCPELPPDGAPPAPDGAPADAAATPDAGAADGAPAATAPPDTR